MTTASATAAASGRLSSITNDSRRWLVWLYVALLLVVRGVVSLHAIGLPGLQMDESMFVNAATLRIPNLFLLHSFHGLPLMDFPYVGALKSWLYAPLFSVFGTSAAVIRIPVVVMVSIALILAFVAVRDLTNPLVALLAFTVLCFDNSVFWLTRDDVGPSAIEFLLKCAALACAARFARSGRRQWLILLLLALGVGVFNKLNFIWIVNAAVVVSVVVAIRERRRLWAHLDLVLTWVIGLLAIYVPFGLYYVENHISTAAGPAGTFQPWTIFEHGMSWTLSGTWFYAYALAPLGWRPIVVWIVLACFAAGTVASVALPRTRSFAVAAIALVTLLIALQCLATSQATAGWHYVAVYPFVTIVASYGVWSLSRDLQRGHDTVVTADWGIFNPLFALHPSRRYAEFAFGLEDASPGNLALQRDKLAALPGPKLVVTHAPAKLQFPNANTSLFKALGSHLRLAYHVAGADGQPVYLVYRYR